MVRVNELGQGTRMGWCRVGKSFPPSQGDFCQPVGCLSVSSVFMHFLGTVTLLLIFFPPLCSKKRECMEDAYFPLFCMSQTYTISVSLKVSAFPSDCSSRQKISNEAFSPGHVMNVP